MKIDSLDLNTTVYVSVRQKQIKQQFGYRKSCKQPLLGFIFKLKVFLCSQPFVRILQGLASGSYISVCACTCVFFITKLIYEDTNRVRSSLRHFETAESWKKEWMVWISGFEERNLLCCRAPSKLHTHVCTYLDTHLTHPRRVYIINTQRKEIELITALALRSDCYSACYARYRNVCGIVGHLWCDI